MSRTGPSQQVVQIVETQGSDGSVQQAMLPVGAGTTHSPLAAGVGAPQPPRAHPEAPFEKSDWGLPRVLRVRLQPRRD
jgi:hypothetical protein